MSGVLKYFNGTNDIPVGLVAEKYQVGDIFITTRSGNPATLLGYGTWSQIKDRFLLAAGDVYKAGTTGGEATHTLTVEEMPSHNHRPADYNTAGSDTEYKRHFTTNLDVNSASTARSEIATGSSGRYAMTATTSGDIKGSTYTTSVGGSQPHNNMPPYLAVNMWIRTA